MTYDFEVRTTQQSELLVVDHLLMDAVQQSGLQEGVLIAFVPHTTAGITINENADPAVRQDLLSSLNKKIPHDDSYRHLEGNSAAHIKASLLGSSVLVPVVNSRLKLGTWQSVFFAEFDGPRCRQLWVIPIFSHTI